MKTVAIIGGSMYHAQSEALRQIIESDPPVTGEIRERFGFYIIDVLLDGWIHKSKKVYRSKETAYNAGMSYSSRFTEVTEVVTFGGACGHPEQIGGKSLQECFCEVLHLRSNLLDTQATISVYDARQVAKLYAQQYQHQWRETGKELPEAGQMILCLHKGNYWVECYSDSFSDFDYWQTLPNPPASV